MKGPYTFNRLKPSWRDYVLGQGSTQHELLLNGDVVLKYSGWTYIQVKSVCDVANGAYFLGYERGFMDSDAQVPTLNATT